MKNKYCIFNKNKLCDDCGECYRCELNPNKICDSCGKCLELEGYDIKEIKIDEILKTQDEINEYNETYVPLDEEDYYTEHEKELLSKIKGKYNIEEKGSNIDKKDTKLEYIEDNCELSEMLTDRKKYKNIINEVYPGLIKIKKKES